MSHTSLSLVFGHVSQNKALKSPCHSVEYGEQSFPRYPTVPYGWCILAETTHLMQAGETGSQASEQN